MSLLNALIALIKRWGVTIAIPFSWTGTMNKWKYFSEKEVQGLESEFVAKLEKARHEAGIPFIITSGYMGWSEYISTSVSVRPSPVAYAPTSPAPQQCDVLPTSSAANQPSGFVRMGVASQNVDQ